MLGTHFILFNLGRCGGERARIHIEQSSKSGGGINKHKMRQMLQAIERCFAFQRGIIVMALRNDDRSLLEPVKRVGIFTIGFRVLSGFAISVSLTVEGLSHVAVRLDTSL